MLQPLSPKWWVHRLYTQIVERQRDNDIYGNYYCGVHPVPWLPTEAREEFARLLALTRSNYMGLVVDAQVERQEVVGFRVNTREKGNTADLVADDDMWRIWQDNGLDSTYDQGLLEAGINGTSYLMVEPNSDEPERPHIHIEHPDQVIVEHVPGTNRRAVAAGLKMWLDDWTGHTMATLYLMDNRRLWLYKFRSHKAGSLSEPTNPGWVERESTDGDWPQDGRFDRIPIWESPNNPRLLTGGRSEIDDLLPIQDRINKVLADRLLTQDFGAFPQKWASGWPEVDQQGNPAEKIRIGRDRLLRTAAIDTKFGQFAAADLQGYIDAKQADVKDIASRSRTPAQYLLGDVANVAGDTLRMAESGLVAKVRQRCRSHSVALEGAMRAARELAGLPDLPSGAIIETLWRNPEFRTEGELVDALVKMSTLRVPHEALWERWGATPAEIARWRVMAEEEQRRLAALDPLATLAGRYGADAQPGDNPVDNPNDVQRTPGAGSSAQVGTTR